MIAKLRSNNPVIPVVIYKIRVVNKESETRWSLNCRFKGIFSPYKDKKLGEFFEPISLRAASIDGMKFNLPKI